MPECEESKNGRSQWEADYPTHGIDLTSGNKTLRKEIPLAVVVSTLERQILAIDIRL